MRGRGKEGGRGKESGREKAGHAFKITKTFLNFIQFPFVGGIRDCDCSQYVNKFEKVSMER